MSEVNEELLLAIKPGEEVPQILLQSEEILLGEEVGSNKDTDNNQAKKLSFSQYREIHPKEQDKSPKATKPEVITH